MIKLNRIDFKQDRLEEPGFTVIRFTDEEVLTDISCVRESILGVIEKRRKPKELAPRQQGALRGHLYFLSLGCMLKADMTVEGLSSIWYISNTLNFNSCA